MLGRHRVVVTPEIEEELKNHIKFMEKSLYGLTTVDVRRLAYDVADLAGIEHPFNKERRMAGEAWLSGFFSRHTDLAVRQTQGTNLSRAVGFNKAKVDEFFTLYGEVHGAHAFTPSRMWNMDETGITNVHKPGKIVATKGVRQVSKMTSGERGSTVTVICAMNATGSHMPPMFIFPRKRMVDTLMTGAPPQSVGYASSSGWTDADLFIKWLQHFVKCTNASKEVQQIIVLDGHHSHKTLAAVLYAREHGIQLLTLPPHSMHTQDATAGSHVLQIPQKRLQCSLRQLDGDKSREKNIFLRYGCHIWKGVPSRGHSRESGAWICHMWALAIQCPHFHR